MIRNREPRHLVRLQQAASKLNTPPHRKGLGAMTTWWQWCCGHAAGLPRFAMRDELITAQRQKQTGRPVGILFHLLPVSWPSKPLGAVLFALNRQTDRFSHGRSHFAWQCTEANIGNAGQPAAELHAIGASGLLTSQAADQPAGITLGRQAQERRGRQEDACAGSSPSYLKPMRDRWRHRCSVMLPLTPQSRGQLRGDESPRRIAIVTRILGAKATLAFVPEYGEF